MISYLTNISRLEQNVLLILRFLIETTLFLSVYIILFVNISVLEGMELIFHVANILIWLLSYKIF